MSLSLDSWHTAASSVSVSFSWNHIFLSALHTSCPCPADIVVTYGLLFCSFQYSSFIKCPPCILCYTLFLPGATPEANNFLRCVHHCVLYCPPAFLYSLFLVWFFFLLLQCAEVVLELELELVVSLLPWAFVRPEHLVFLLGLVL